VQPQTRYAKTPDGAVAYQTIGDGPIDIVFVPEWLTNIEVMWEEPRIERFFRRLSSFSRVIVFDKRGVGVSDPVPLGSLPTLEQWIDDIRAVMDAAGSERAAIIGHSSGGPMAAMFSATYPARVTALVLGDTFARVRRDDDFPMGLLPELAETAIEWMSAGYGTDALVPMLTPSLADDDSYRSWLGHFWRLAMSPAANAGILRWVFDIDVRSVLGLVRAPTLVLHRTGDRFVRADHGRYLAEHIPGARFVAVPGDDHFWYAGDQDALLDEVEVFLTGVRGSAEHDRVLATVMFTDIVGSTERVVEMGDRRWGALLDAHDSIVRRTVEAFRGRLVRGTGDGALATFDGPARAIRCARAVSDEVHKIDLEIRCGLHTGEVELRGHDVGGLAVHMGARVLDAASPGEVLVSNTVKDLAVGADIDFVDRGMHVLKGVPGEWHLYAVNAA
jgi:pimeloyl-ACP methyl ester carboxylesterase